MHVKQIFSGFEAKLLSMFKIFTIYDD